MSDLEKVLGERVELDTKMITNLQEKIEILERYVESLEKIIEADTKFLRDMNDGL